MVQPETKYARVGGDRIAYRVLGAGPPDLVMTTGNYSHVDMVWEDPGMARFLRTLASFSRLIVFDRRGTGASDLRPLASLPPWESYAQDLTAVPGYARSGWRTGGPGSVEGGLASRVGFRHLPVAGVLNGVLEAGLRLCGVEEEGMSQVPEWLALVAKR